MMIGDDLGHGAIRGFYIAKNERRDKAVLAGGLISVINEF